ncbi:MAG TPA: Spy/CpxP family protein refolding chaperone [Fimbriimonadaceae bacterium]|nr:Spy/CpxP family protein refolding chaperone [Fimbriimonadaceae bacterium]
MKRLIKVTAIVATMAMLVSASMAQGGGGQGRGQGRGMGQGMMGGRGGNLLAREDVQKELNLTDAQKSKIKAIMDKAAEDRRAMMEEMRNGGGDREAMTKQMADAQAKVKKETDAVLNDEQKKRLQEIEIQVQGARALLNADVQKALGITDAQKKSLDAVQQKQMDRMREMMEEMRNSGGGGGGGEDMRAAMQENQKKMETEMLAVLTAEQKTKFESMKGKKFEGAAQAGGQFGGGRGGNRGGGGSTGGGGF